DHVAGGRIVGLDGLDVASHREAALVVHELSLEAGELLDGLEAVARHGKDDGCARYREEVDEIGEDAIGDCAAAVEVAVALDRGPLVAAPVDELEVRGFRKKPVGDLEK